MKLIYPSSARQPSHFESEHTMPDLRFIQTDTITAAYVVDRRGDWHLIARSDMPEFVCTWA